MSINVQPALAPPVPKSKNHIAFVDGVRALAAMFVVIAHSWYEPSNGYYAGRLMNHLGLTYGMFAVDAFIVVSGFCLMLPAAKRDDNLGSPQEFFKRRAWRILPPYYASLILSSIFILTVANKVTGTVWDTSVPLTLNGFLKHVFLLHDLPHNYKNGSINYPLRTIAIECQIYLLMPLLVYSFKRFGSALSVGCAVLLGLILHFASGGWLDSATPWYIGLFAFGAFSARECVNGRIKPIWRIASIVLWGLVGVLVVVKGSAFYASHYYLVDTVVGLATAALLGATYSDRESRKYLLTRVLSWPPIVKLGLFSYSLYLIHAPVLHAFDLILKRTINPRPEVTFVILLCASPLIIGLAYLFHLAFEKPFITSRKPATAVPVAPSADILPTPAVVD